MATGFIYVVTTVDKSGKQNKFSDVPTEWGDQLYFGPCKATMRPLMNDGDYVFGVSPAKMSPTRHILFVGRIEKTITFAEAYNRLPELRGGPSKWGPIHVRPINGTGNFPDSHYEHIPGANHEGEEWRTTDLKMKDRDRFFVFCQRDGWLGRWLGINGPEVAEEILTFFKACSAYGSVFGRAVELGQNRGTLRNPIACGVCRGLHLKTYKPEDLVKLCDARLRSEQFRVYQTAASLSHSSPSAPRNCDVKRSRSCR